MVREPRYNGLVAIFKAAGRVARMTRFSSDSGLRPRLATPAKSCRPTRHTLAPGSLMSWH